MLPWAITTKLPANTPTLYSVSRNWERAIERREVYKFRMRLNSREECLVFKHSYEVKCEDEQFTSFIPSYSMREKRFPILPPIPHLAGDSERFCQLIASSVKLYVVLTNRKLYPGAEINRY